MFARSLWAAAAVLLYGSSVNAGPMFSFSGSDAGGTASAEMEINISGSSLTLTLDNTSPLTLNDGTGVNSPAITGFGFDTDPQPNIVSWSLTAFDMDGNPVTIGGSGTSTGEWELTKDSGTGNIELDFYAEAKQGVHAGLYNPAATSGFGNDPYFTRATLTIEFNANLSLVTGQNSPFVRFQNVGRNGAGSLKLGPSGEIVPEPTSLALAGIGALGMLGYGWRRRNSRLAA